MMNLPSTLKRIGLRVVVFTATAISPKTYKGEGKSCGKNRVLRVMRREGLKALIGYKRHPVFYRGSERNIAPNRLNREFIVPEPDQIWVTDFTYIRTKESWLYVTIVVDLFSRIVVG